MNSTNPLRLLLILSLWSTATFGQVGGVDPKTAGQVWYVDFGHLPFQTMQAGSEQTGGTVSARMIGCVGPILEEADCSGVWRWRGVSSARSDLGGLKWHEPVHRRRKLRFEDIRVDFDNGLTVGMQRYYENGYRRRWDLGMRGNVGEVGVGVTLTHPGLQLHTEVRGVDLNLRVGGEPGEGGEVILGIRNRW